MVIQLSSLKRICIRSRSDLDRVVLVAAVVGLLVVRAEPSPLLLLLLGLPSQLELLLPVPTLGLEGIRELHWMLGSVLGFRDSLKLNDTSSRLMILVACTVPYQDPVATSREEVI